MDFSADLSAGLGDDFAGVVRLFPLPNVVLFPNVLLPLRIFEPRYVEMMHDALEGDKLLAMALLKSGDVPEWDSQPEIHPVICIGRIIHHVELEDGHYNVVLQGLTRAKIVEELPFEQAFRTAAVELMPDQGLTLTEREEHRRTELLSSFRRLFPNLGAEDELHQVFESAIPLGALCDLFAYALSMPTENAQRLLSEPDIEQRCRILLDFMETATPEPAFEPDTPPDREFPPPFSLN